MKEFFGFGGYQRPVEGFMSWQHIVFVSTLVVVMLALAIFLGIRYRKQEVGKKNRVLILSAILIDSFEIFKIVLLCIRSSDPLHWIYELPLFLCSIQLITIPLAAFSKGRLKETATDFVFIFGLLGALLGTYGAGNNYGSFPVLSFDNVVSGVTHCIAGFASLYIGVTGMATMKKKNVFVTFAIMFAFCMMAYTANLLIPYNYMFLMRGDGTPYDIIYNMVGGNPVLYPISVVVLFLIYIIAFYGIYFYFAQRRNKKISVGENGIEKAELTVH